MSGPRERVAALWTGDHAARAAGITVDAVSADRVELVLEVTDDHANGHGILHGGYVFLLADTALAYACAALDRTSVTRTADIAFLTPARLGEVIRAVSQVRVVSGRLTICDVQIVSPDGTAVAEFRGHAVRA